MRQQGQDYSYLYDGKGNVTAVLDSSQNTVATYTYDEFGRVVSKSGTLDQPFQFSTKYYDQQTGLNYYGYRFYSPVLGRWINRDPLGERGGVNLYGFVENDPVNWVDPLGLEQYNHPAPRTVPVTGTTKVMLDCVEACLKRKTKNPNLNLMITGGAETSGHTANSHHYKGEACDVAGPNSNPVNDKDVMECATRCGFGAGHYENFPNTPNANHWHLQQNPGNGVPALPGALPGDLDYTP